MSMTEALEKALKEMNLSLTQDKIQQFELYYEALKETGAHTNLTSILDDVGVAEKHFAESLLPIAQNLIKGDEKIIDVGAGAGFPGLPLKIFYPALDVTLVEATGKKATFIEKTAEKLDVDVTVINLRAEEIAHSENVRMCYDICVSRALARLSVLLELCAGFVKLGGRILAYKGMRANEEINEAKTAAKELGLTFVGVFADSKEKTQVVVYERTEKLKDIYPRKFSNIKKKAL